MPWCKKLYQSCRFYAHYARGPNPKLQLTITRQALLLQHTDNDHIIQLVMAKKKTSSSHHTKANSSESTKDELVHDGTVVVEEEKETEIIMHDDDEEEEMVYLQVDTGDVVKLKQVLDEAVAGSVLHANRMDGSPANHVNLPENRKFDNVKLVLMTLACIFALIAQFSPLPFPDSRVWVGLFCALYFVLSGILQYTITFIDKDCIFVTQSVADVSSPEMVKKNPLLTQYGLRFRSSLPRFSEFYSIIIEFQGMEKSPFVKQTWSVGKFFDKDGMFDEYGLAEEVVKLFRRFECGNFDSDGSMKVKTS
jgi:signal peptidase complex subunit 2